MEREIDHLRKENKLLRDTGENVELLKEENGDLRGRLDAAQSEADEGRRAKQDLGHAMRRIKQWESACLRLLDEEERRRLSAEAAIGPEVMEYKVGGLQRTEIALRDEKERVKSE